MIAGEVILKHLVAAGEAKSKNSKLALLHEAKNDSDIKQVLPAFIQQVLDPGYNYYMTAKNIPQPAAGDGVGVYAANITGLLCLLQAMADRAYTGKAADNVVATWLHQADSTHRWLFKMAIERQLPGKVGRTLVNLVWKDLIYKQPYGGCKSWDESMVAKRFDFPHVVWQTKEDGMTLLVDVDRREVRTRAGQDVSKQMEDYLKPVFLTFPQGKVAHFEAKYLDDDFICMPRPEANGHFNALFKSNRPMDAERIELVLLDLVDAEEFYGYTRATEVLASRLTEMESAVCDYNTAKHDLITGWPDVTKVYSAQVDSLEEARKLTQQEISFGGEGGIIKRLDGVWKSGKMLSQMKMKNEFECTLVVTGYKPHSKQAGWVGSLLCESLDGDISTYVGSGLNEEPGHELNRTLGFAPFDGQLVEIKAEKISKYNALDLPRIMEIRHDKVMADTGDEVRAAYADSLAAGCML